MLHVRVVCPTEHTSGVLTAIADHPGAAHLTLVRGAAVDADGGSAGDLVTADVAREAADELIERLCELGVDHVGGITVTPVEAALSDAADAAERAAPGDGADAVVWRELLVRTGEESRLTATFQAFLVLACLLAAVGVITNSMVTVVGAMVVGPEFGPLAAVAVGLVCRDWPLVRRGAVALAVGFPLAVAVTAVLTLLGEGAGLFDASALRDNNQVDFVYQVGPWSLIVALLAGAAGMLSMTSTKATALIGVFISVTTVPAAGYAAVAAVLGQWDRGLASLGQLAVNLVGIVVAGLVVLLLRPNGRPPRSTRPLTEG